MIPLILTLAAAVVIPPGAVPVVADVHPNETQWIQEIKESRRGSAPILLLAPQSAPRLPHPLAPAYIETLIQTYFLEPDWEWARRVSFCESGWDASAKNPNSSASGLFQPLARYWDQRSAWYGWAGADIFDPVANTAVSAGLYYDGGPGHWVCK